MSGNIPASHLHNAALFAAAVSSVFPVWFSPLPLMSRTLSLGLLLTLAALAGTARAQVVVITPNTTTIGSTTGTVTFTATISYTTAPSVLAFSTTLPPAWTFLSGTNLPPIAPAAGTSGTLSFSYITTPASPATFSFTASYPAGLLGLQPLASSTITRDSAGSSAVTTNGPTLNVRGTPIAEVWLGGTGNWTDASQWSPSAIPLNSGLTTYSAQISAGAATLSSSISIDDLLLLGGTIGGNNTLTLLGAASSWTAGAFATLNQLTIATGAQLTASGTSNHDFGGTAITNNGQFNWQGSGALRTGNGGSYTNSAGAVFNDASTSGTAAATQITSSLGGAATFTNAGNYVKTVAGETKISVPFTNSGAITVNAGNLHFDAGFTQNGGNLVINSGAFATFDLPLNFAAGSLLGGGTVQAAVTNFAVISPGNPIGALAIQGNLTLQSTSQLIFDISAANAAPGVTYDFLNVTGTVTLGGVLTVQLLGNARSTILPTDTFTLLTSTSPLIGAFTNVASGTRMLNYFGAGSFLVTYTGNSLVLSNFDPIPEPSTWALMALGTFTIAVLRLRKKR